MLARKNGAAWLSSSSSPFNNSSVGYSSARNDFIERLRVTGHCSQRHFVCLKPYFNSSSASRYSDDDDDLRTQKLKPLCARCTKIKNRPTKHTMPELIATIRFHSRAYRPYINVLTIQSNVKLQCLAKRSPANARTTHTRCRLSCDVKIQFNAQLWARAHERHCREHKDYLSLAGKKRCVIA